MPARGNRLQSMATGDSMTARAHPAMEARMVPRMVCGRVNLTRASVEERAGEALLPRVLTGSRGGKGADGGGDGGLIQVGLQRLIEGFCVVVCLVLLSAKRGLVIVLRDDRLVEVLVAVKNGRSGEAAWKASVMMG